MNLYAAGAVAVLLCGAIGASYVAGSRHGAADKQAQWAQSEAARNRLIETERVTQALKVDRLNVEIETLRARPERVRTITKEIHVLADADCRSLPADWRRLFNAAAGDQGVASGGARLGDPGVPAVADDPGRGPGGP